MDARTRHWPFQAVIGASMLNAFHRRVRADSASESGTGTLTICPYHAEESADRGGRQLAASKLERAVCARAWHARRTTFQLCSRRKSIAAGTARNAAMSRVPCRCCSSTKPDGHPQLTTSGASKDCTSRRAYKKPDPFGAHIHLWQVPA